MYWPKFRVSGGVSRAVQPITQQLARFEKGHLFGFHLHRLTRARVAPHAGVARFHRKRPKAAQFNAITLGQSIDNLVEYGADNPLHMTLGQMWIVIRDFLNQFRSDHNNTPQSTPVSNA